MLTAEAHKDGYFPDNWLAEGQQPSQLPWTKNSNQKPDDSF